ncbi:E3 ubiquitin-protein ligase [Pseudolycoriella hygida]|uniref:RING-type E3 ubiquitin transferase n=1 Tax=Pseudolycoriella hygida TaxID=35572 RepID=A0A9Q0N6G4_9DIPT|nr:E3 ubiquitin-protein ligase [Pseudolycoriella hygida]
MSMSEKKMETETNDNKDLAPVSCVVCFKHTEIFSIGECDHVVCYECSARLRVLLKQNDCMICRAELSQVIFTTEIKPFIKLTALNRSGLYDSKYRICFTSLKVQSAFNKLLENPCSVCSVPPFPTFGGLKDHMRKEHELFYCDICTDNLTIFSFERKCYNRVNLGLHRRRGDPDNTSHKGHPRCEFCDRRYLDRDELFRHLRREHYYCHFCDADGLNHYYADYEALRAHFQSNHYLCEDESCAEEKFTSVFRTEIDLRAHIASTHGKSLGKLATKQARTLEVEFTLAPRNRVGESSRGPNRNNNYVEEEFENFDTTSIVQHPQRSIDAQNEQEFPSLGGASSSTFTVRPSVSIRTKTFGPGGLARTKENFPALGGGSSDVSPIHKKANNNGYTMGTASALFKNGNTSNTGKVMIHLSNRPSTSTAPKKSEVNPNSSKDFPSLGRKANLDNDFVPVVPINQNSVAAKHRAVVSQTYESAVAAPPAKVATIQRETPSTSTKKPTSASAPKLNSKDNFPSLGGGTDVATTLPWITTKKQPAESRKSKVAPPPLAATTTKSEPKPTSSTSKVETKANGKANNKKEKVKAKVAEKKEETKADGKSKGNKKTESKPQAKSDSDEIECVPSQSVLNVVSAKHRSLINGYESNVQSTNKLQFVKRDTNVSSEKSAQSSVPSFSSTNNFPSLGLSDSLLKEKNNNNMPISFIDIMKNAKDPMSNVDATIKTPNNDSSNVAASVPPGFDKSRKKQPQPPPGFNSVTLNSVAKPTNNLTFTSSLGESYSILPTHHYLPPKNSTKRNKALFAHFQKNEEPEAVEQFQEISRLFIQGSYLALPYYQHCKFALKDKFDVIFPELLVLLPDINKQQELFLVHSQQEALSNKNKKPTKKNQNLALEVCATCKQVLISSDLSTHLQSHSLENNFPKLGNQNDNAINNANAWKK